MTAAIASNGGRDLFASFRTPAWHRAGLVFTEEVTSSQRMLELVGLDQRTVTVEPVYLAGESEPVAGVNVTVSRWEGGRSQTYASVGDRYGVMSDAEAFGLWDGFRWETGGALYDGRKVFGSIALEREIVLDPSGVADVIKSYGLVVNSHDGTSPLIRSVTPIRVVCQNTLNVAMGNMGNVIKVRHTQTVTERAKVLAEIQNRENGYLDVFETEAAALYAAKVTDKQYLNLVETMIGKADDLEKAALTKYENKRGLFMQSWNGAPNAGIKGTAWGAFNALTEANQWGRNERDGARGADSFASAGMGLDGPTNTFRAKSLALVKSRVGIK